MVNKKVIQFIVTIMALVAIVGINGCDLRCERANKEPVIYVDFSQIGSATSVFAIKDGENLPPVPEAAGSYFSLPFDLNAKSVTYYFQSAAQSGEIQFFYQSTGRLDPIYDDCGFLFEIEDLTFTSTDFPSSSISGSGAYYDEYQIVVQ